MDVKRVRADLQSIEMHLTPEQPDVPTEETDMNRPLFAFALFLFVWPAVTVLSVALEIAGIELPIAVRTFLTSAILVPSMVFAVAPALNRIFAHHH
ncbi:MAG: hypothetical protein QNJ62_00955 [Methyloceanibacter sp.]|nr:hypothetical protein [Methyloceanibacter sp.]